MLRAALLASGLSLLIAGCEPELGECNAAEANRVVFFYAENSPSSGTPAYEGQALMQKNCSAGGFCHSPAASGPSRIGAPAGLNFDVQLGCELGSDGLCPEAQQPGYDRLLRNAQRTFDHARSILAEVEAGTMPPSGSEAEGVVQAGGEYFRAGGSATFDAINGGDTPLPELDSSEGREILRNWLACGAPVIGATRLPDAGDPGQDCGVMVDVGECVVRFEPPEPPEPTWASIYDFFAGSNCVTGCHDGASEGAADVFMQSMLDLSDQSTAYTEMVGVTAEGDDCADMGTLVEAGNAEGSLLIQKLEGTQSCGEAMPDGRPLFPEEFITPIRQWIDDGAAEM